MLVQLHSASKQARKQARKRASKQASKQARCRGLPETAGAALFDEGQQHRICCAQRLDSEAQPVGNRTVGTSVMSNPDLGRQQTASETAYPRYGVTPQARPASRRKTGTRRMTGSQVIIIRSALDKICTQEARKASFICFALCSDPKGRLWLVAENQNRKRSTRILVFRENPLETMFFPCQSRSGGRRRPAGGGRRGGGGAGGARQEAQEAVQASQAAGRAVSAPHPRAGGRLIVTPTEYRHSHCGLFLLRRLNFSLMLIPSACSGMRQKSRVHTLCTPLP